MNRKSAYCSTWFHIQHHAKLGRLLCVSLPAPPFGVRELLDGHTHTQNRPTDLRCRPRASDAATASTSSWPPQPPLPVVPCGGLDPAFYANFIYMQALICHDLIAIVVAT